MTVAFVGHQFLIEEAVRAQLRKDHFNPKDVPWLVDFEADELVSHIQPGLFGPAVCVIDIGGLRDIKATLAIIEANPDCTILLLDPETWTTSEPAADVARKRKAQETRLKTYERAGFSTHLMPTPTKGALVKWTLERAKSLQVRLDRQAASLLAELFPDSPASIASELGKLALLELQNCDAATLGRIVNEQAPTTIFQVLEHVAKGNRQGTARTLERLLSAGEDPFKLMGALVGNYQLSARARGLLEANPGISSEQAARSLAVHPFRAQKALELARTLDERRVYRNLKRILEADISMKSGLDAHLVLELLVLELAGR